MLSKQRKEEMSKRVLELAEKYGSSIRFYPEGSEGKKDDALDDAIKTGENAAKTPEEQKQIDEARRSEQMLEQERANVKTANEVAREAQSDLETTKSENETLKEQLVAAEAKAAEAGVKDVELDASQYSGTDVAIIQAIKSLKTEIKTKDGRIDKLEEKASATEKQRRRDEAIRIRDSEYEEVLSDLDTDYGADCRNDAIKKFNEIIAKGEVPKGNTAKATRILERCYKEAKAAKTSKKDKSSLSLDSGSGGGGTPNLSGTKIRSGQSLDEAVAQITADSRTG